MTNYDEEREFVREEIWRQRDPSLAYPALVDDTISLMRDAEEHFEEEKAQALYQDGVLAERKRIMNAMTLSFGLYGGFYPEIGKAILSLIKEIDPTEYEAILEKLGDKADGFR